MSWTESELRTRSLESRLEEILEEEDYNDISEQQRHRLLDILAIRGSGDTRMIAREMKEGA